jgi:hypothetical protein
MSRPTVFSLGIVRALPAFCVAACLASTAASAASLAVNFPSCDDRFVLKEGLLERLRFELQPSGINEVIAGPWSDERVFENATLVLLAPGCGTSVELRLYVPPFKEVTRRAISLEELNSLERTRLISLVAAELLTLSTKAQRSPVVKEANLRELGVVSIREAAEEPPCSVVVGLGVMVVPSTRTGLASIGGGGACRVGSVLKLDFGLRGSIGSNATDLGSANTRLVSGKAAASLFARGAERWLLAVGLGLEVGWLHIEGVALNDSITGKRQDGVAVIPALVSSLEAPVTGRLRLLLFVEVGYLVAGLEARAQGLPVGGISGAVVSVGVGAAF